MSRAVRRQLFALVLLVLAVHAPFTGGGWLTDDFLHLERLERQDVGRALVSPDTFGFYRPLPQASLLANLALAGPSAIVMRLTNLLVHAAVIAAAFCLARLLLGTGGAAFFATLAFALTPKAHPIVVLWISARAELLMALLSLLALIAWIRWQRGDGAVWLAAACGAYAAALLSKETAVLLPLVLMVTPPGSRPGRARLAALAGMAVAAALLLAWRTSLGALVPASSDAHYDLATPVWRWLRNARNYFWRAIVSPGLFVLTAGAARLSRRRAESPDGAAPPGRWLVMYAAVWFAVFLLPVVPIAARSEHYLYLPVFGLCLLAGAAVDWLFAGAAGDARNVTVVAVCVLVLGGFQVSRAAALHADAVFSARFLAAVRDSPLIAAHAGSVRIVPADEVTRRSLQDAIGGYIGAAVDRALGRHVPAGFAAAGEAVEPDALLLECRYRDGLVTLRPDAGGR